MRPLRVLFMGTPEFAVPTLQAISDGADDLVGVVTQPDRPSGRKRKLRPSPVKRLALELGALIFQPETLKTDLAWSEISSTKPDVCVVVAYGQILRQRYLDLPTHGCWNVHASLLPRWRGAAPINWAVWSGDTESGVCAMQMERGLDTGPVVREWRTDIRRCETAGELHDRLAPKGARLIAQVLDDLRDGRPLSLTPQDNTHSTYARMLTKGDGLIDFDCDPSSFANHVHGMTPWPGAICETSMGPLKLCRAEPRSEPSDAEPGVVLVDTGVLEVAVRGGSVRILECQKPGKRVLAAEEFLHGLHAPILGQKWR